ncbi:DUF560 domain-containing protein [candidate division KSB1 bacterium]|nr:DUF560 domain-containing protein [candidate division KSB1 bacterium]
MKSRIIQSVITGCLVFLPSLLYARIGLTVDAQGGYASNIVSSYRQIPDTYQALQGQLHYRWIDSNTGVQLAHRAEYTTYNRTPDRDGLTHALSFDLYHNLKEQGDKVNAGVEARTRLHSELYDWSEYRQGRAYLTYKTVFTNRLYAYIGWEGRIRSYPQLGFFSYHYNREYLRLSRFFDSGTTLIFQVETAQKDYLNESVSSMIPGFTELITLGDGASRQLLTSLRLARALSAGTGVSGEFSLRRNLKSSVRTLGTTDGYYFSDEELFDDPFSYESEGVELTVKQRLPALWLIQAGTLLLAKHYRNRLALDLEGYAFADQRTREDQRSVFWFSLSKSFKAYPDWNPLTLSLDFSWMHNRSNDPYYDYHLSALSLGVKQNF